MMLYKGMSTFGKPEMFSDNLIAINSTNIQNIIRKKKQQKSYLTYFIRNTEDCLGFV